ncbi:MAG TPA: hypothetical protein DHD79_03345 [Firmicutes bacterium]|jgi:hypothetical protein|nr:hypothetical protein [Bacillota bacterium]HAW71949.1 hypothetical protein [Bacillota bacterium]HAZ22502.1 hypothetical protein [Bacillota bacterium]HBE04950.1 hypothetical protein [Bacillota bacterium]HBG45029.1 hypothetical protein [Bacillota bacterium]
MASGKGDKSKGNPGNEKKAKPAKKKKPLTPQEKAKLKVARELGFYEQVREGGWGSLSAKECGQVGGILSKKIREKESRRRA